MRTGAVIQARMSSSRLPGKVLRDLPEGSGVSVIEHVVERTRLARSLDEVILATSDEADDDPIAVAAEALGVACYRGALEDVVGRFVGAIDAFALDRVVRITADCPCVDPAIIDAAVALQAAEGADYTSNVRPRSYPKGLDVEVVEASVLRIIDAEAAEKPDREHVLTYVYLGHPERFRIANLVAPAKFTDPDLRVTLDTRDDYEVLSRVFEYLGSRFDTAGLFEFFREHPGLRLTSEPLGR